MYSKHLHLTFEFSGNSLRISEAGNYIRPLHQVATALDAIIHVNIHSFPATIHPDETYEENRSVFEQYCKARIRNEGPDIFM